MKNGRGYYWLLVIGLVWTAFEVLSWEAGPHRSTEAQIKCAFSDIHGGLKTILEKFKKDCGRFPTTAEGLKVLAAPPADGSLTNWHGPYIDLAEVPKDPWGHEYVYCCPGIHMTNGYDLYSIGPDGRNQTGDDICNWYIISRLN